METKEEWRNGPIRVESFDIAPKALSETSSTPAQVQKPKPCRLAGIPFFQSEDDIDENTQLYKKNISPK